MHKKARRVAMVIEVCMVDDNLIWKVEMEEYRLWEGVWSFRVQKIMKQRSIADEEAAAAAMIGWLDVSHCFGAYREAHRGH